MLRVYVDPLPFFFFWEKKLIYVHIRTQIIKSYVLF